MTLTAARSRPSDPLRDVVTQRVGELQAQVLRDVPTAIATIARLRRCDPANVGAEPLVWQVTLGDLPDELTTGAATLDGPSPAEHAIHACLVLYALHQQSRDEGMHYNGVTLGHAVGQLARARAHDEELDSSTVKHFHQVALANDFAGRMHFLRGLIQLMRAAAPAIRLDYGLLALDLRVMADPRRSIDHVLYRWGRDLHHIPKPTTQEQK